jgi:hypothetical protein
VRRARTNLECPFLFVSQDLNTEVRFDSDNMVMYRCL